MTVFSFKVSTNEIMPHGNNSTQTQGIPFLWNSFYPGCPHLCIAHTWHFCLKQILYPAGNMRENTVSYTQAMSNKMLTSFVRLSRSSPSCVSQLYHNLKNTQQKVLARRLASQLLHWRQLKFTTMTFNLWWRMDNHCTTSKPTVSTRIHDTLSTAPENLRKINI